MQGDSSTIAHRPRTSPQAQEDLRAIGGAFTNRARHKGSINGIVPKLAGLLAKRWTVLSEELRELDANRARLTKNAAPSVLARSAWAREPPLPCW